MARGFVRIDVVGDKRLARLLRKLDFNVQKKAVRRALRTSAEIVLQASKAAAPVDTGALRDTLRILSGLSRADSKKGLIGARVVTGTRQRLAAAAKRPSIIEDEYYYPTIVEYKQHPFLRRTADENFHRVVAQFARELRAEIAALR